MFAHAGVDALADRFKTFAHGFGARWLEALFGAEIVEEGGQRALEPRGGLLRLHFARDACHFVEAQLVDLFGG